MLKQITKALSRFSKKKSDREKQKSDEQPDTTHMPKLEGDESAEQQEDKG